MSIVTFWTYLDFGVDELFDKVTESVNDVRDPLGRNDLRRRRSMSREQRRKHGGERMLGPAKGRPFEDAGIKGTFAFFVDRDRQFLLASSGAKNSSTQKGNHIISPHLN
jgi:hypothetical protein